MRIKPAKLLSLSVTTVQPFALGSGPDYHSRYLPDLPSGAPLKAVVGAAMNSEG